MDILPPFHRTALLLDMDGTLIDLAPTPDAVVVAPGLTDTLVSLRDRLGGALAIVTGRPIETVDRLLGSAPGAVAGEHGGAIRRALDAAVERPDVPAPPAAWLEAAEALVAAFPGALLGVPLGIGLFAAANHAGIVTIPPASRLAAAVLGTPARRGCADQHPQPVSAPAVR